MSRWICKGMVVLAVAWVMVWAPGCPDEPVVENVPAPGEGMAPPPAPGGDKAREGAQPAESALGTLGETTAAAAENEVGEAQEKEGGASDEEAAGDAQEPGPPPGGQQLGGPGGIPLTPFPPNILTQDEIKKGDFVTLKGKLSGDRCKGHKTRIEVMTVEDGRPTILTMKLKKGIGLFEILVPKGEAKLWVTAVCDLNGNNKIDLDKDYVGAYADNPVVADKDKTGIAIRFQNPGTKPKGFPPINDVKPK